MPLIICKKVKFLVVSLHNHSLKKKLVAYTIIKARMRLLAS